MIKTFRGLLADGGQDRIRLQTIKGKVGYRIVKFELVGDDPQTHRQESVVKIFKEEQSSLTGLINFTDSALLAVAVHKNFESAQYPMGDVVIFDNETFNQDIYVTHTNGVARGCNYYIELEVIPLDDAGAEYTTLKDLRQ